MKLFSSVPGLLNSVTINAVISFIIVLSITVSGQTDSDNKIINKKYPEAPLVKSISKYEVNSEDSLGRLLSKEFFNDKGWKTEYIEYSYFDTEEVKEIYEYNENGKPVRISAGEQVSTLAYNDKGLVSTVEANDLIIEFIYGEKNHLQEMKFVKLGEALGYQRFEYKFNEKDSVTELKKYDKFIDEQAEILQLHRGMKYDDAGNVIEETIYIDNKPESVDSNLYNEYGKCIQKLIYDYPDRLRSIIKYEYDDYGNFISAMYKEEDGTTWGEKFVYEYAK